MKIRMQETRDGADDGYTVRTYQKGEVYEVGDDLGHAFVDDGAATEVAAKPKPSVKKKKR